MAGQGVLPRGPREARWWVQDSVAGEHLFWKCSACGATTGPHHKVIRATNADLSDWYQAGKHGTPYGWQYGFSVVCSIVIFVAIVIIGSYLVAHDHQPVLFLSTFLVIFVAEIIIWNGMNRYNRHLDASRDDLKAEILRKYGPFSLRETVTGVNVHLRDTKYVLLPNGVMNELQYYAWED